MESLVSYLMYVLLEFLFSPCCTCVWIFFGGRWHIHWERFQEQKVVETTVHSFRLGPFVLNVPGDSYAILEYFNGSHIAPNTAASYIFLLLITVAAVFLLAVFTTLPRFWFFVGMGLFIAFIVSLRFEVLAIAGYTNRVSIIIVLLLYVVPGFYFNQIRSRIPFINRLITFAAITVFLWLLIQFFAGVDYPFYHLTLTAYTPGIILSIVFIIMVSHEIMASFVFVAGQGTTKSLQHLSIICVIYLVNVVITCFHELGVIHWNFIYINLYLLLTFRQSWIMGIPSERIHVSEHYPFAQFGAVFVALATICFATKDNC